MKQRYDKKTENKLDGTNVIYDITKWMDSGTWAEYLEEYKEGFHLRPKQESKQKSVKCRQNWLEPVTTQNPDKKGEKLKLCQGLRFKL